MNHSSLFSGTKSSLDIHETVQFYRDRVANWMTGR